MKIAYLILAHDQPRHLARLVKALDTKNACFFIHIDKKSDKREFERLLPAQENVIVLKDTIKVYRFDFSQVAATLKLLRTAFESQTTFHSYCLLSGSDFLLKDNRTIENTLSGDTQFIRMDLKVGPQYYCLGAAKGKFYLNILIRFLQRILFVLPRRAYNKIPIFQGSQWWALTHDCIEFILCFLDKNKDYIRYMRHIKVPDESFFHSLVKASPFCGRIYQDFVNRNDKEAASKINEHGCHYIDWNTDGVILPKVLDLSDRRLLAESKALFARKFRYPASAGLVEWLETKRQSSS